jgi:16S rRNA pseudouridine516 synthase
VRRLLEGVVLDDDPRPVRAAACELTAPTELRLTLTEGKYHQVKRMVAAVGNRVEALHRSRIGGLALPPDLQPGQWRWLGADDLAALR